MNQKASTSPPNSHQLFSARRLTAIFLLFSIGFAILGYRAFDLQVNQSEKFKKIILVTETMNYILKPLRGEIYDRHKSSLALTIESHSISCNPRKLLGSEKPSLARKLSKILNISPKKLLLKLYQDRYFVWLKRHVSEREVRAIKNLKLGPSVQIRHEYKRTYPNGRLASHILGYTDKDGKGLAGIEKSFDKFLQGKRKILKIPRDPKGRKIFTAKTLVINEHDGANVILTIDKTIQFITERALAEASQKWKVKRGMAVVMNPNNGDILALAVYPDYDPNHFNEVSARVRNNAAISNPYEPGSTMKVLTASIAQDLNLIRSTEKLNCEGGRLRVGRHTIRDDHPHHWLTPPEVIKYSSNICTYKIAKRIGKKRLYEHLRLFNIGLKTNVALPGESRGLFRHYSRWSNVGFANISFGQGVAVTALQLTAAVSAIANGGIYYRPRIYQAILDDKGHVIKKMPPTPLRRVISQKAAKIVTQMMVLVTQKGGTGTRAAIEGIPVAGKTGTAQKAKNGRYGRERIGSFIGFLPADNPKLTILVVMDEPHGSKYGGTVAAPAWKRIAIESLRQLGYTPPLTAQHSASISQNKH